MEGLVYVGGEFRPASEASVNVFDHGLLYGDGVFEGIRAYNGRVFKLERHIERLFDSAKAVRLEIPHSPAEVCELVAEACRRNDIVDGYIRLVVTRGPGDLGVDPRKCPRPEVIVIVRPTISIYQSPSRGIRMITSSLRRPAPDSLSPAIKSLNYLNNVMAKLEASDRGADEALILDAHGFVTEATVDNIFIAVAGGLITPPTATNLMGVTRETVIELAADLGVPVAEKPFTVFDVWTAREVFICGTGVEVVPVVSVDERTIGDGTVGSITRRLVDAYARRVRSEGWPLGTLPARLKAEVTVTPPGH